MESLPHILVVLGPTSSGKSALAVELAKKYNGEIISADSRQVYKGLNIGAGKITKKEMKGIPHHLLDVVSPKKLFTVQDFKTHAERAIKNILKKNKLPIICGGTGFYIQSIVDNVIFPEVLPNKTLREALLKKTSYELFTILTKLDPIRARDIDPHNNVRLVRAIEIATELGNVPPLQSEPHYKSLQIGIETTDEGLKDKIYKRLLARLKQGMVAEATTLHEEGLSWKRMEQMGLEYRYLALFLQKKISKEEMIERLTFETRKYARRQKTWFRKDKRIKWFPRESKNEIEKEIEKFLTY
ncbi:tRNA (adenosine(37)-N6)-dimethylallyltransferase MiaA [Patescibacteria group bacterium]|nr:tRNA (adenosine(37)-N6)-dimethylallyltransferase MiaA [Patescibacteria group bacterium]